MDLPASGREGAGNIADGCQGGGDYYELVEKTEYPHRVAPLQRWFIERALEYESTLPRTNLKQRQHRRRIRSERVVSPASDSDIIEATTVLVDPQNPFGPQQVFEHGVSQVGVKSVCFFDAASNGPTGMRGKESTPSDSQSNLLCSWDVSVCN